MFKSAEFRNGCFQNLIREKGTFSEFDAFRKPTLSRSLSLTILEIDFGLENRRKSDGGEHFV